MLEAIREGPYEAQFRETLRTKHGAYDPDARLLREEITGDEPVGFVDLPAGTTVHPTRESLGYAVALLDAGERTDRALAVLDRVLSLQDDRPDSEHRGCWPYYAEVSLAEMERVDENWAAFLGKRLVELLADHADALPEDLRERSRAALARAARFLRERDVTPGYTNIALMSAFVVLAAGERLGDDELHEYGRHALRELVGYTRYHDGFTEYNSPTYTRVSLRELGRMRRYFEDDADLALARELEGYAWRILADHYHPPTGGLAGPHLRAYANADTGFDAYVHLGTGGARGPGVDAISTGLTLPKLRLECPERYWRCFGPGTDPRFVRDRFYRGDGEHGASIPVALEARTHLTDRYALGTFTKSHCWYQSRPLIARWGSEAAPCYLRARWLRDGHDFASGVLAASQFENLVAGAATLVTDNGDRHPAVYESAGGSMDPRETLSADRLIVRFEVGGGDSVEAAEPTPGTVRVTAGGVDLVVTVAEATLGERTTATRLRRVADGDGRLHVDVVLHEGDPTTVDLATTDVAVAFGLRIGPADGEVTPPPVDSATREERTVVAVDGSENPGRVAVPRRPVGFLEFLRSTSVA